MVLIKCVEYVCPILVLLIIAVLKISIDNKVKLEQAKRIIAEGSIDVMSLAISFVLSYLIALVNHNSVQNISNELAKGFICFLVYVLCLIVTVLISKYFIRMYSEKEKIIYLILGVLIGYTISVSCTYYSILLLRSLGGV